MKRIVEIIEKQRAGKEGLPEWVVGEQLLDIASESELNRELIERDLEVEGMSLSDAAKKIKEYADKNRGKASSFAVSGKVADGILREFYGIGKCAAPAATPEPAQIKDDDGYVDLAEFI